MMPKWAHHDHFIILQGIAWYPEMDPKTQLFTSIDSVLEEPCFIGPLWPRASLLRKRRSQRLHGLVLAQEIRVKPCDADVEVLIRDLCRLVKLLHSVLAKGPKQPLTSRMQAGIEDFMAF